MYHCRDCGEELDSFEREHYEGYCAFCYESIAEDDTEIWKDLQLDNGWKGGLL